MKPYFNVIYMLYINNCMCMYNNEKCIVLGSSLHAHEYVQPNIQQRQS